MIESSNSLETASRNENDYYLYRHNSLKVGLIVVSEASQVAACEENSPAQPRAKDSQEGRRVEQPRLTGDKMKLRKVRHLFVSALLFVALVVQSGPEWHINDFRRSHREGV